jgi:hypothetical protein
MDAHGAAAKRALPQISLAVLRRDLGRIHWVTYRFSDGESPAEQLDLVRSLY